MRASLLLTVILRLFAIHWVVASLGELILYFKSPAYGGQRMLEGIGVSLAAAILVWTFASRLAHRMLDRRDAELRAPVLSVANVYALGFILVGGTAATGILPTVLAWIYWLVKNKAGDRLLEDSTEQQQFVPYLITFAVGVLLLSFAPALGRVMAGAQGRLPEKEARPPEDGE